MKKRRDEIVKERDTLMAALKQGKAEAERDELLSALKQWRQATESRLKLLDSRGEASKAMLKPDADLIAVLEGLDG